MLLNNKTLEDLCAINTILLTNPKHIAIQGATKEINSIPARASTAKNTKLYLKLQISVLSGMLIKLVIHREIKKDSAFI